MSAIGRDTTPGPAAPRRSHYAGGRALAAEGERSASHPLRKAPKASTSPAASVMAATTRPPGGQNGRPARHSANVGLIMPEEKLARDRRGERAEDAEDQMAEVQAGESPR